MTLDIPDLDDRTYEDLLEQAKKLIPAYSDEWTDFNPHDPGITILEVLAWLTESHMYQLDQVTDEHRETYLKLVGHRRRGPKSAVAELQITPPAAAAGTVLQAGTSLAVTDGMDDAYRFETDHDIVLTDAAITEVITAEERGTTQNTEVNRTDGMFYRAFGQPVAAGDTLYLGFDSNPFEATESLTLMVDYHDEDLPESNPSEPMDQTPRFQPSVSLQWEYCEPTTARWESLQVVSDQTATLYGSGPIELARTDQPSVTTETPPVGDHEECVWIRCRVETPGYEIPPQLNAIRTNVVTASHRASITNETLTRHSTHRHEETTALDRQQYAFAYSPILEATVQVDGEPFSAVPDFDASDPNDRHYVLDRERGEITFGDGVSGRAPDPEATVTADYVHGGGADGNVSSNSVWRIVDSNITDIDVEPMDGATGGADSESLEEALRRAKKAFRRPYRAVTAEDCQSLAARTPGLRIGRTNVIVAENTITVIVVPYSPPDIPKPVPSDGFLRTIRRNLRERMMVTDQVTVTGPTYVGLEITVTGTTHTGTVDSGHETAITDALNEYLHPLYGGDGSGWAFGRTVVAQELAEVIAALDEINHVADISITAHGGTAIDDETVMLNETALVSVEDVVVDLTPTQKIGGH